METKTIATGGDEDTLIAAHHGGSTSGRANELFATRVRNIPGVVRVEAFGGEAIGGRSFRVYVRDGDVDAEYAVYQLQGEVYDRYPEARLTVELLEQSDIPEENAPGPDR